MRFILASLIVLTAACASSADPSSGPSSGEEKTLEEAREEALQNIDREACEAGGGEVRQAGLLGMPRCITPYFDAGQSCSDASDCEGRCMAYDDITDFDAPPGAAKGVCEKDDSPFGCYAIIDDGVASSFTCVD